MGIFYSHSNRPVSIEDTRTREEIEKENFRNLVNVYRQMLMFGGNTTADEVKGMEKSFRYVYNEEP